jgi:hypothetical protein
MIGLALLFLASAGANFLLGSFWVGLVCLSAGAALTVGAFIEQGGPGEEE